MEVLFIKFNQRNANNKFQEKYFWLYEKSKQLQLIQSTIDSCHVAIIA